MRALIIIKLSQQNVVLKVGTLNVGILQGHSGKILETLSKKKAHLLCGEHKMERGFY